jgi:uncharacterized membrane protein
MVGSVDGTGPDLAWLAPMNLGLDAIAIAWFLMLVVGYQIVAARRPLAARSIVDAVQRQRVAWMLNMAVRDNRTLDAIVLQSLGQGNAFFASTSVIAIGGLAAIMGSGEKVQVLLEQLPYVARSSPQLWDLKVLVMIGVFIYAFFKFAWAFRLSHYTGIMIGATPIPTETNVDECRTHAERTATLIGIAAEHSNGGLRSFYYAMAVMAWFFHPLAFMAATSWVLLILVRRDFHSRSLRVLSGRGLEDGQGPSRPPKATRREQHEGLP